MLRHDLLGQADSDLRWSYTDADRDFTTAVLRIDVGPLAGGSPIASGTSASLSGLRLATVEDVDSEIEVIMPDTVLASVVALGGRARYTLRATWGGDDTETLATGIVTVRPAVGVAV